MPWPTPQDYNEAIQNPRVAFTDPDLKDGEPELNKLGIPRAISGGFASVYKIRTKNALWAARCFTTEVTDQQQRYEAISKHLARANLDCTVPFLYLPEGIKVNGVLYPLVKMQWIQGETLNHYIEKNINIPNKLSLLASSWCQLQRSLKNVQIAHGDLQHGNVVVVADQVRLLDYDGMFVPALAGKLSNELGHRNYQHPARQRNHFGEYLDNFSAWVVYVSLVALSIHPEIWSKHRGGDECIIFRKADFDQPNDSEIIRDLRASPHPKLRSLIDLFCALLPLNPADIPALHADPTQSSDPRQHQAEPPKTSWWNDYLAASKQANRNPTTVAPPYKHVESIDLDWIIDSAFGEGNRKLIWFTGPFFAPKAVVITCLVTISALGFSLSLSPIYLVFSATLVMTMGLVICYRFYKADPCHAEMLKFKAESEQLSTRLQESNAIIDLLTSERMTKQGQLAAAEVRFKAQKEAILEKCGAEIVAARASLGIRLHSLAEKRDAIALAEPREVDQARSATAANLRLLGTQIAALDAAEADEKANALRDLQSIHLNSFLRRHSILGSQIPGVSPAFQRRLVASGLATAADVSYYRVTRVRGIGESRGQALVNWRRHLESKAQQTTLALPDGERSAIELKYNQLRSSLESTKQQYNAGLLEQLAFIKKKFSNQRQQIDREEQELRMLRDGQDNKIRVSQERDLAAEQRKMELIRMQLNSSISDLSVKLDQAHRQAVALRWRTVKRDRDGQSFPEINFMSYLQRIVSR